MTDMKIVVNKRPESCKECLFSHTFGYDRYCKITSFSFDKYNETIYADGKMVEETCYDYTMPKDLCPLITLEELEKSKNQEDEKSTLKDIKSGKGLPPINTSKGR